MAGERISEDAVERLAKKRAVDVHGEQWGGYHAWEKFMRERPADLERYREQAREDLEAAYPAILSDLRRELLSDEAVAAAALADREPRGETDFLPTAKAMLEAALDSLPDDSEGGSE